MTRSSVTGIVLATIGIIIVLGVGVQLFFSIKVPIKLKTSYNKPISIEDSLDLIDDAQLLPELEAFYRRTGIPITVITGEKDFDSTDEDHWFLVYTTDSKGWHFECVQGANTDKILTPEKIAYFNTDIQNYLSNPDYTVTAAFATAISGVISVAMSASIDLNLLALSIPLILIGVVFLALGVFKILSARKIQSAYED